MKIYTKTGDKGDTDLIGRVRVTKSHPAIEVCGSLDELNSRLGVCRSLLKGDQPETVAALCEIDAVIVQIQKDLFDVGSCVAACLSDTKRTSQLSSTRVSELEQSIDRFDGELPQMDSFILPDGSTAGCELHLARSVCRRCERRLVELLEFAEKPDDSSPTLSSQTLSREFDEELIYLNRLSDLLFVLARFVNQTLGCAETKWLPGK